MDVILCEMMRESGDDEDFRVESEDVAVGGENDRISKRICARDVANVKFNHLLANSSDFLGDNKLIKSLLRPQISLFC